MGFFERADRELMQQIVLLVDKDNPALESEGVGAAALASVNAYLARPESPAWREWAAGHFGKSVRRADARAFPKIVAEFGEALGGAEGELGDGLAIAFAAAPKEELPKKLAKLQVAGTQLPRTPAERAELLAARQSSTTPEPPAVAVSPEAGEPSRAEEASAHTAPPERAGEGVPVVVLVMNDALGMSTGKAAAQAAHALFAWLLQALRSDYPRVDAWLAAEQPLEVRWASADEFAALRRRATGPLIRDAGRTEIEPGSVTAFVI